VVEQQGPYPAISTKNERVSASMAERDT